MVVPDFAALQDNVRSFWDIQDKALDAMENLANGWFERRHVGTHAALEAAQRMCKAQTPADGVACQEFVGALAGPLSSTQEPKPQRPETKTAQHSKAA